MFVYYSFIWLTLTSHVFCSNRIIGGKDAEEGAFPYQGALIDVDDDWFFCGGSIIGNCWILTAAHCLKDVTPDKLKVVAGTTVLHDGSGQGYQVQEFRIHQNFTVNPKVRNDIALLKLKECITFNDKIKSIPLATEATGGGKPVIMTGWGYTKYPGKTVKKLQKIDLITITDAECYTRYYKSVDYRNICTQGKQGKGLCHGDSGGPLAYKGTQVGVVSWGIPCAGGVPDVFTDVFEFKGWIEEQMKQ